MMWMLFVIILFAVVDVWYLARSLWLVIKWRLLTGMRMRKRRKAQGDGKLHVRSDTMKEKMQKLHVTRGVVLPYDIDFMLHMNNAKYLQKLDFGLITLLLDTGIRDRMLQQGGRVFNAAQTVRYRKPIRLFQHFTMTTKILYWEGNCLYLEQRIITMPDNFVAAIAHVKVVIKRAKGTELTIDQLVHDVCGHNIPSPNPPADLQCWIKYISLSSDKLRSVNMDKSD